MSQNNRNANGNSTSLRLKTGLAEMLKGGVIMDVTNEEQAEIAEKAGAVAVMALERVPAKIRLRAAWLAWLLRKRSARLWRRFLFL